MDVHGFNLIEGTMRKGSKIGEEVNKLRRKDNLFLNLIGVGHDKNHTHMTHARSDPI